MAQQEDFKIDQGSDVTIQLNLENVDGSRKNLTGYTGAAKIKPSINASDSDTTEFTVSVGVPEVDGILNLSLTNIQTDALDPDRYLYDVEISYFDSDSDQVIERILEGKIEVTPSITK